MRKLLILFFIFSFLISFAYASYSTSYSKLGSSDNSYSTGNGLFSSNDLPIRVESRGLINGQYAPIIYDLDDNGVNEIIISEGASIIIYQSRFLDIVDDVNIGTDEYTSPIVMDIDDDGLYELILMTYEANNVKVLELEFDGVNLIVQRTHTPITLSSNLAQSGIMGCDDDSKSCLAVTYATDGLDFYGFNSTHNESVEDEVTYTTGSCPPVISDIPYGDFDNSDDGVLEAYVSAYSIAGGDENLYLFKVEVDNLVADHIQTKSQNAGDWTDTAGDCSVSLAGYYVSPPMAYNINGGGGYEISVAGITAENQFKLFIYDTDLDNVKTYPPNSLFYAIPNANYVSNIFTADVSSESDIDICVTGFANQTDPPSMDVLCGFFGRGIFEDRAVIYTVNLSKNLSLHPRGLSNIVHSAKMSGVENPDGLNQYRI